MEIVKTDISTSKEWNELLQSDYNMFFDYKFISYNNYFSKDIKWHHLLFKDSEKNRADALLTGCERIRNGKKTFISCDGVSFGGFIWREKFNVVDYIEVIKELKSYLIKNNFQICIIRNQPNIYQKNANEEYEYALVNEGFTVLNHSITNIIDLNNFHFDKLTNPKKRAIQKSDKKISIEILDNRINQLSLSEYYNVLLRNRETKNVRPTHSLEELVYIKNKLKERIIMFSASIENKIAGICILFLVKDDVALNFYLATDEVHKKDRIADFILYKSIEWTKQRNFRLYDIGTSNVGDNLLTGLFEFKKKFMANGYLRKSFQIEFTK